MNKVVLYLAEGFEEVEALAVVDVLRRGGVTVDMACVGGSLEVKGSHDIKVIGDLLIEDIKLNDYQMIVLPGGMPGTLNLKNSSLLKEHIKEFYMEDKYIAAICAAPMILGEMGLLKGKRATCYPGVETKLLEAIYIDDENIVIDQKFITSKGVGTALLFGTKLLELLEGLEISKKITTSILL